MKRAINNISDMLQESLENDKITQSELFNLTTACMIWLYQNHTIDQINSMHTMLKDANQKIRNAMVRDIAKGENV